MVRCRIQYDRSIRRGVCLVAHDDGGGHYVRLPVWELMCVLALAAASAVPLVVLSLLWALDLLPGKE